MGDLNGVKLDEDAIYELLHDPAGPVGRILLEKATEGAVLAKALAPVRHGNVWSAESDARPEGFTKASVHPKLGVAHRDDLYGSFNAAADPTIFLELPAEQLEYPRPFMRTALWSMSPV